MGKIKKCTWRNLRGPNFFTNFLPFPPNLQDIGCPVVIFPKGCYIWVIYDLHNTSNHPWKGWGDFWNPIPFGSATPRRAPRSCPAGTARKVRRRQRRRRAPWHPWWRRSCGGVLTWWIVHQWMPMWMACVMVTWNVGVFLTHGLMFFFGGGIFLNGGLVKQQFWFFLVSSLGLFLNFLLLFSCWSTPEMPWQLRLLRSQYQPCGWFEGALFRIAWTITPPKLNWHSPWRKRWERKMILSL